MAVEPQMQRRWEEQLAGYVGASLAYQRHTQIVCRPARHLRRKSRVCPRPCAADFQVGGMILLKHMVLVVNDGVIENVFYPVFPPDESADEVISWLENASTANQRGCEPETNP
jgi:hypothetical protein